MAAINTGKVITGGLAAGVALNVIDFLSNTFVLGGRSQMELSMVNPSIWAALNDPKNIAWFVAIDFALGILVVWLYAAIRPRFGAGPGTAVKAGVFTWVVGGLIWSFFLFMGLMSLGTYALGGVIALVNFVAAAWVGGMMYREVEAP